MKSEDFFGLLGGIDSKMIEKASEDMYNWQRSQEGEPVSAVTPRKAALWLPIASVACAAAVVIGGFFLIRNIRQNGSFGFATDPNSSFVQGVDSDSESRVRVPVSTEISESNSAPSGGSSESVPAVDNAPTAADNDPTKLSYDDMTFEAVDPVNDLITYSWTVEPDRVSYELLNPSPLSCLAFEDSETSLQYLWEFFGNKNPMLNGLYLHWQRCLNNGQFECDDDVSNGTSIIAPVGGRVISVAEDQEGFGNAVAVEIPGQKIFVIYHLDEVLVNVDDVVTVGQVLGVRNSTGAVEYRPQLSMVIMKKKTDPPEQERSESFDGLTLGISTNKRVYEFGEPIHLTATVENNTGKDIYISYGGSTFNLNPRIEDLVEYPERAGGVMDDIAGYHLLTPGEKIAQDFTFQTYTGYLQEFADTADFDDLILKSYPDPDKPAESGTYSGELAVTVYFDYPKIGTAVEVKTYTLDFEIEIKGDVSGDETAVAEDSYTHYTEEMLKDYFIYDRVLYTNCYTCPVDWVIDNDRYGYNFDFSHVGELVATISGRADLQTFGNNTANILPDGTEIYEFLDYSQLLIAKTGDKYIPYMGMREG